MNASGEIAKHRCLDLYLRERYILQPIVSVNVTSSQLVRYNEVVAPQGRSQAYPAPYALHEAARRG